MEGRETQEVLKTMELIRDCQTKLGTSPVVVFVDYLRNWSDEPLQGPTRATFNAGRTTRTELRIPYANGSNLPTWSDTLKGIWRFIDMKIHLTL